MKKLIIFIVCIVVVSTVIALSVKNSHSNMIEENIEALSDGETVEEMKAQPIWYIGPVIFSDGTQGIYCETGGIEVCID